MADTIANVCPAHAPPATESPEPRSAGADLLACLGLTNLLFLLPWQEVQTAYSGSAGYFRAAAPSATLLSATLAVVLGCTALFCGAWFFLRRSRSPRVEQVGRCLFLLAFALATPGPAISMCFPSSVWVARAVWLLDRAWLTAGICAAALVWDGGTDRRPYRAARHLTIVISPLLPLVIGNSLFAHWTACGRPNLGSFESATQPGPSPSRRGTRILVLVFDELDALAFSNRPASVRMPAFDRLRQEGFWVDEAHPPARCTLHSLPMLITGRNEFEPAGNGAVVKFGRVELPVRWGVGANLFAKARVAGARTGIIGWYHPYCSALAGSVDYCWSLAPRDISGTQRLQEYCRQIGFARCAVHVLRRHVQNLTVRVAPVLRDPEPVSREHEALRKWNLEGYIEARRRLLGLAADPSYRLVLAHLPIPHPLGIYDRHTDRFTLNGTSNYFDNLELADSILGEVRSAVERAGLWDTTAVIVTSDHGLRPQVWNSRPTWTAEEAAVIQDRESLRVPLMVKLPARAEPHVYTQPVNALIAHDLALELLRDAVRDSEALRMWMDANRTRTWVRHLPSCF